MKNKSASGGDKIGYCNPPKHSRFRKGQSGNPKGRPRGSRSLIAIAAEELERKVQTSNGPRGEKMKTALELAQRMQEKSSLGLSEAKRLVNDGADLDLDDALRMEIERVHRYATTSHDAMEGLMAFRDKRKPRFEGH